MRVFFSDESRRQNIRATGTAYEICIPSTERDKIALNAAVDPILINPSNIRIALVTRIERWGSCVRVFTSERYSWNGIAKEVGVSDLHDR